MATRTKLPEFKGKSLIEIPKNVPQADFLRGDFGKAVLEEYKGRVSQDYDNSKGLKVLSYSDGLVKGSNPFAVVLVNQILRQEGLRTATQADLEKILGTNAFDLTGTYEDSALVLRSEGDPNSYLAKDLHAQVNERLGKKAKLPVMIPLAGLNLVKDQDSDYGLAFKLRENSEIMYAPILNEKNGSKFSYENIDENTGLPKETGNGNRTLYTIKTGLSWLNLGWNLGLYSDWGDYGLAYSDGDGRVVAVSAEGASQNLGKYLTQMKGAKEEYLAKLSALKSAIDKELESK